MLAFSPASPNLPASSSPPPQFSHISSPSAKLIYLCQTSRPSFSPCRYLCNFSKPFLFLKLLPNFSPFLLFLCNLSTFPCLCRPNFLFPNFCQTYSLLPDLSLSSLIMFKKFVFSPLSLAFLVVPKLCQSFFPSLPLMPPLSTFPNFSPFSPPYPVTPYQLFPNLSPSPPLMLNLSTFTPLCLNLIIFSSIYLIIFIYANFFSLFPTYANSSPYINACQTFQNISPTMLPFTL